MNLRSHSISTFNRYDRRICSRMLEARTYPSRLPIADWENFAARRVESVWLAETGAAPENRVFLRTGKI
jgi:hypothetical protein